MAEEGGTDEGALAAGARPAARRSRAERWRERLENSRHAFLLLFVVSFMVVVPIEAVLVPFMLLNRDRIWRVALVATLGVVAAGAVGYVIGYYLFETLGRWVIAAMDWEDSYRTFRQAFAAYGFWALAASGVVPIPFEVVVLAASAAGYPFLLFLLALAIARGVRYFGLAFLVWVLGDRAVGLWRRHRLATAALAAGAIVLAVAVPLWLGTAVN